MNIQIKYIDIPSSCIPTRCAIRTGDRNETNTQKVLFIRSLNAPYFHQNVNAFESPQSSCIQTSHVIGLPSVNPKLNKRAVTPCASSKCLNMTMVAHLPIYLQHGLVTYFLMFILSPSKWSTVYSSYLLCYESEMTRIFDF